MKVTVIHSIYQPYTRGGAERVVSTVVAGLQQAGHRVSVICLGYRNETKNINGVEVHYLTPFNVFNFLDINSKPVWLRFIWHIIDTFNDVQAWKMFRALNKIQPDLVLTHNLKGLGYYTPWVIKSLGVKHIHTLHDMQLIHPSGLLPAKLTGLSRIYSWVCKRLFNSSSVVIFPSQYLKSVYDRLGYFPKSQSGIVPNPLPSISPVTAPDIKSTPTIQALFLGQVEEYKGILDLIQVVNGLDKDLILHVVGDGSVLQQAKALAGKKIRFYGRLTSEQIQSQIWPMIDILINPSLTQESFGMVVIEAYAQGVPVMVSNRGALPELVKQDVTGWIVQDDWQSALTALSKQQLRNMRSHCLNQAENYRIDGYLNSLMEFVKIQT